MTPRRFALMSGAAAAALVVASAFPATAASQLAIKRAIVQTILTNLGVDPTAALLDELVARLPMDTLNSALVKRVGKALDTSGDVTTVISTVVDTDGDGIPNETADNATVTDEDLEEAEHDDDDDDDSSDGKGSGSGSTSNSGTGGTTTTPVTPSNPKPSDDDDDDEDDEDEDDDEDDDDEDDDDDHDGDN